MRKSSLISSVIMSLMLSSCAYSGLKTTTDVKLPMHFQNLPLSEQAGAGKITGDWWKTSSDPILLSIIAKIEASNLSLEQARSRLLAARASSREGAFLPNINTTTDIQYNRLIKGKFALNPIAAGSAEKSMGYYNGSIDASWELPIYGQLQDTLDAKKAGILFAEADIDYVRMSMRAEAIRLYIEMRRWQNVSLLKQKIEKSHEGILYYQNIKLGAGMINDSEKEESEKSYISAKQDAIASRAQLLGAQYQLATILGISEVPEMWGQVSSIPLFEVGSLAQAPIDVMRQRPDIQRAEAVVLEQSAMFELSKSEMYPKFTLAGTLSQLANVIGSPLPGTTVQFAGVPAISMPLFDWNQRLSRAKQEDAKLQEVSSQYRQTVISAMNEVNEFYASYNAAYKNQEAANHHLNLQKALSERSEAEFKEGVIDGIEQQKVTITSLETDVIQQDAQADKSIRLTLLIKALGVVGNDQQKDMGSAQ